MKKEEGQKWKPYERPYVIECGGLTWRDRFVYRQDLPWGEWSRSSLRFAKSFTLEEAEDVIKRQGFGEAVLRSKFESPF